MTVPSSRHKRSPRGLRRAGFGAFATLSVLASLGSAGAADPPAAPAGPPAPLTCPSDMVSVQGFCVDRWEASMVDKASGERLSPYYPPHPRLLREVWQAWELDRGAFGGEGARAMPIPEISEWQRTHKFEAKAVSRSGVVPQAYLPYPIAKRACENAGKRLCTRDEWTLACQGEKKTRFPYGETFDLPRCNVWRPIHPGITLHQSASFGHRDPRLNLVVLDDEPLLRLTGASASCASRWGKDAALDMVGNVDEWVEGPEHPEFVGGFYARATKNGCESRVTNHGAMYYDYSVGVRCCRDGL